RPDAVTLDVLMPEMDGWTVLSRLKSDPEISDVPVVMTSMIEDRPLGLALGASDYLTKPVNRQVLLRTLSKHVHGDARVLVVEDDISTRNLICKAVRKEGWSVQRAANGREALELVAERPPSLILLDL